MKHTTPAGSVELYKEMAKCLEDTNAEILERIHGAIASAEFELDYGLLGLRDYIRAPFGRKPTGVEVYDALMKAAESGADEVVFSEHVLMGPDVKHVLSKKEIGLIVKWF